ncbi:hypothetical protein [Phaeobacter sp. J2-8]|uniref:hypothetical protein n=1 Tax=Phaeobacter sp. J2-8 TaxID=2931394 RepID=UPI001FD4B492|nr:hypothetical protein [Phaeobacter sp. J2-8]MCJ7872070.1 hypothetical protein [Phaeobacter sp. J2-8]
MGLLRRFLVCILLAMTPIPVLAKSSTAFFDSYLALRARLDPLMKNRDIAEVMRAFGDASEESALEDLERRVRNIFPRDFQEVALIRRQDMDHGFRQELIAYWDGVSYIYVYLVIHQRDDGLVTVVMNFNTEFDDLNSKF